jgi:WD40 repeat protein
MRCRHRLCARAVLGLAILAGPAAHAQSYPRIETGHHTAMIWRLSVDRAERWVATASEDKTVRVWNLKTGQLEQILRPPVGEAEEGKLYTVALSPDGSRVITGGFTGPDRSGSYPLYLFDRATGHLLGRSRGFSGAGKSLAFSRDGARLAAAFAPGGMRILDARDLSRELAADDDCKEEPGGVDFDGAGRLVTACADGVLRLYDAQGTRIAKRRIEGGALPYGVSFSPDGTRIAVGFADTAGPTVASGRDLTLLYKADTSFAQNGHLASVRWSQDGARLYAGGMFSRADLRSVVAWPQQGRRSPVFLDAAPGNIMDTAPLARGRLLFASGDLVWGVLGPDGRREQTALPDVPDFGYPEDRTALRLSPDGTRIEFGFHVWDGSRSAHALARFDLTTRTLETGASSAAAGLTPPRTKGLAVTDWSMSTTPKLNGQPLTVLRQYETSHALSIATDSGFVLGTDWYVRSLDASGRQRWSQPAPDVAWAVNQSADGRFVVAAFGDGTIRWYEAATGRERLALFVHARDQRWVLFTPEGFYQASPGGDALLGYQLNQGPDHEGRFVDSAQLSTVFLRPDLITARLAGNEAAITAAVSNIGDVRTVLAGDLPPTVTLLSAAVADSTSGEYTLTARITPGRPGARVGELQVTVNGAAVQSRASSPAGGGVVTQRLSLGPGVNTVSLRVLRADGKVASNAVVARVTVPPSQVKPVPAAAGSGHQPVR